MTVHEINGALVSGGIPGNRCLIAGAYPGGTIVFPAEIKDRIVHPSASFSIVTRLAKDPKRESMEDCSNSDRTLPVI
jgi:hypothetical protein